jgi:predicted alpha/beta hydrolase family esterase
MSNVFIFHGTEGYPDENWFPWLKKKLESSRHKVFVPQFPSPPIIPAKISEWLEVFKAYERYVDDDSILIGHSLGGIFTLRILEKLKHSVRAAIFVGTPVGVRPILNYDRDNSFSGFSFDWPTIRSRAQYFAVFQSDNDPYVSAGNGEYLATKLGVELSFVPGAGHFNTKAGYLKFDELLEKMKPMMRK